MYNRHWSLRRRSSGPWNLKREDIRQTDIIPIWLARFRPEEWGRGGKFFLVRRAREISLLSHFLLTGYEGRTVVCSSQCFFASFYLVGLLQPDYNLATTWLTAGILAIYISIWARTGSWLWQYSTVLAPGTRQKITQFYKSGNISGTPLMLVSKDLTLMHSLNIARGSSSQTKRRRI